LIVELPVFIRLTQLTAFCFKMPNLVMITDETGCLLPVVDHHKKQVDTQISAAKS